MGFIRPLADGESRPRGSGTLVGSSFFGGNLSYIGFGGSGKQVRDLLHVADLADLVILQLRNIEQHRGQTYNVGGGLENSVSLQELTKTCQELSGNEIPINSDLENRPGDIPWFVTESSKIIEKTGWKPKRTLDIPSYETHKWIVENREQLQL